MSDKLSINTGDLYENAAEAAERALAVDTGEGYGLEDIADEETLVVAFTSVITAPLIIEGTLKGCLAALTHVNVSALPPLDPNAAGPAGTSVDHDDMQHAHAILSLSIGMQLDDDQRSQLILSELPSGYLGNPTRMSSIVLAIVSLCDEIIVRMR
jgi:hypothetical protein